MNTKKCINMIKLDSRKPTRYRFHPFVRFSILLLASIVTIYCIYFIVILIPKNSNSTLFSKLVSILVLYVALNSIYRHLTGLNSVIIFADKIKFNFVIKRSISISWQEIISMQIYKKITHFWKIEYIDKKGAKNELITSLAFPGIMEILDKILEYKPDLEMNELLRQVIIYKQKTNNNNQPHKHM